MSAESSSTGISPSATVRIPAATFWINEVISSSDMTRTLACALAISSASFK
jgi:hypothetical protein